MITNETPIGEIIPLLSTQTLIKAAESNEEIAQLVWNYCLKNNKIPELSYLITNLSFDKDMYINEFMKGVTVAMNNSNRNRDDQHKYFFNVITEIVRGLRIIPDAIFPYLINNFKLNDCDIFDLKDDNTPVWLITEFGSEEQLRITKIKIVEKYPNNEKLVNDFVGLVNASDKRARMRVLYDVNDFYGDLPDEYQMGVVL